MIKGLGNFLTYFLLTIITASANVKTYQPADQGFTDDTTRVNNLNLLSVNTYNTDPQRAKVYARQAYTLAKKVNFKTGAAYALKNMGSAYYLQGNYKQTLNHWQRSLQIFRSINDKLGEANLLSNLGAVYFNQGDDVKALDLHLKSLKVSEQIGNKLRIATSLINIGALYYRKPATHNTALKYYKRALPLTEEIGDKNAYGTAAVNLGEIYLENGRDTLALFYFKKSLKAFEGTPNVPYTLNNMAKVFQKRKDYKSAFDYHNQALKTAETYNAQPDITESLLGLANTFAKQGKNGQAIPLYQKAEAISKETNLQYELKNAYEGLASSYAKIFNYKEAYKYQNLLTASKDSLYNVETDKKLSGLQFDFEIQKKQSEIDILIKNRALQQLELKRQQMTQNSLMVGLILVFIIAFILFRNYQIKSRTNKLLDKQKAEIQLLLSNMLPEVVAKELQNDGFATPRYYDSVSVLFSDFKNFTQMADALSPQEVVFELNSCFMAFDDIIEKHGLEKIKTIGDAYMCAGGVPAIDEMHPMKIIRASLEIRKFMRDRNDKKLSEGQTLWELRIGIHTGPIVAGVVGRKKYAYDIWGSTVNTASRMESNGEPGKVNISAATYDLIKDRYQCTYRGKIFAKNVGDIDMYFVESELTELADPSEELAEVKSLIS